MPLQTPPHISFHHLFSADFPSFFVDSPRLGDLPQWQHRLAQLAGESLHVLVVCHRHTIAEQPVGGGILAYCFRSLLQVVCTGFLIGGGERLGIQFLGLLAVVVEVVVGRGPPTKVHSRRWRARLAAMWRIPRS